MGVLFLLFTVVPAIELLLLIEAGKIIGAWDTVLIVIVTGIVGAYMAKSQGLAILQSMQKEMTQGQLPADGIIHGLLVFVGGVLLITPGFVTDAFGLSLVIPFTRYLYISSVKAYIQRKIASGNMTFYTNMNGQWQSSEEFRDVSESSEPKEPAKVIDINSYKNKD